MVLPKWRYTSLDGRRHQAMCSQLLRKPSLVVALCLFVVFVVVLPRSQTGFLKRTPGLSPRDQASNATLGFTKILTISSKPSWRSRGLRAAANLTGLEVGIPTQPYIDEDVVRAFEKLGEMEGTRRPKDGSAKAWLAHLDMLRFVVLSDLPSALIIEDDMDWDVTIRDQMKLVSDNVRQFSNTSLTDRSPYGLDWDILWIGHCGEVTHPESERLEYEDLSLMETELYAGWSKKWLMANIKPGHRAVQHTFQTVCTFAYGVTAASAQNILRHLGRGRQEAFDVGMMNMCREKKLKCLTLQPELMHHYNPRDGTGYVSPNDAENSGRVSADDSAFEQLKGSTANMKNSARCEALFHETCPQSPTRAEDF